MIELTDEQRQLIEDGCVVIRAVREKPPHRTTEEVL